MSGPDNSAEQPKTPEDPSPVVGNYVKRRKLGEGGFGEVWLADDTRLSRPVALKFLKEDARDSLLRFRREATLASSLSHPNIAAVYEIGESPPFIAMQYIEGQSADKLGFTPREAARVVATVAGAVHAAHGRGIVHRDLKPSNIMIDLDGRPFVMDFGLAKRTDVESSLSQSGIIMGTPSFMSPEQAEGHVHLDGRSDVFSLGSTLYAMLAGVPPFTGETMDVLRQVIDAEPEPLSGIPKDLRTVIGKAMEKDPARRYASAEDMALDLGRFMKGEAISAAPPGGFYRLGRRMRKNPWLYAVGALGAIGIVVTASIFVPMWMKATSKQAETARAMELWQKLSGLMSDAEIYARSGEVKRAREKWDEGIRICRDYLARSEFPHARYFLGRLLHERGDRDGAQRELDRAIELNPNLGEAHLERGLCRVESYASLAAALRDAEVRSVRSGGPVYRATAADLEAQDPDLKRIRSAALSDLSVDVGESSFFKEADRLFGRAELQRLTGRASQALESLKRIIETETMFVKAYVTLSDLAHEEGQFGDAADWADKAVACHKGYPPAYTARARANQQRAHVLPDSPKSAEWIARAISDAKTAIGLGAESGETYHLLAESLLTQGLNELRRRGDPLPSFDEALKANDRAVELAPSKGLARSQRGRILVSIAEAEERAGRDARGRFAEALDNLDRAVKLSPSSAVARNNRGCLYQTLAYRSERRGPIPRDVVESAIGDFEAALEMNPSDSSVRENCAESLAVLVRVDVDEGKDPTPTRDRALGHYAEVQSAGTPSGVACANLGTMHAEYARWLASRGDDPRESYRRAIDAFDLALGALPDNEMVLLNRGVAYLNLGDSEIDRGDDPITPMRSGIADLSRAIQVNPRNVKALKMRGAGRRSLGEYSEALPDFLRAVELDASLEQELRPLIEDCRKNLPSDF